MIDASTLESYIGRRVLVTMTNPGGQYLGKAETVVECAAKIRGCRHLLLATASGTWWTLQSIHIAGVEEQP